jgi:hypothetical protein
MNIDEILVCITNHNNNENAIKLKKEFSEYFETIIIDSKSNIVIDDFDVKLNNVYYTGLLNQSFKETIDRNKKRCFFIASDVYIDNSLEIKNFISSLDEDIYLWAPSSRGQSHLHCKNQNSKNFREVPYLEGFCFLSNVEVVKNLYPISTVKNKYGFGIDLLMGFNCIKVLKKKCVIDDRVEIYHREGTGYDQSKALFDMYNWMLSNFNNDVVEYTKLYSISPGYTKLLEYLKS